MLIAILATSADHLLRWRSLWAEENQTLWSLVPQMREHCAAEGLTYVAAWGMSLDEAATALCAQLHATYGKDFRMLCLSTFAAGYTMGLRGQKVESLALAPFPLNLIITAEMIGIEEEAVHHLFEQVQFLGLAYGVRDRMEDE